TTSDQRHVLKLHLANPALPGLRSRNDVFFRPAAAEGLGQRGLRGRNRTCISIWLRRSLAVHAMGRDARAFSPAVPENCLYLARNRRWPSELRQKRRLASRLQC